MIKSILALTALVVVIGIADKATRKSPMDLYEAWTDTGIHLMMSDNGTDTPEDDIVIDWETNREFQIYVKED